MSVDPLAVLEGQRATTPGAPYSYVGSSPYGKIDPAGLDEVLVVTTWSKEALRVPKGASSARRKMVEQQKAIKAATDDLVRDYVNKRRKEGTTVHVIRAHSRKDFSKKYRKAMKKIYQGGHTRKFEGLRMVGHGGPGHFALVVSGYKEDSRGVRMRTVDLDAKALRAMPEDIRGGIRGGKASATACNLLKTKMGLSPSGKDYRDRFIHAVRNVLLGNSLGVLSQVVRHAGNRTAHDVHFVAITSGEGHIEGYIRDWKEMGLYRYQKLHQTDMSSVVQPQPVFPR